MDEDLYLKQRRQMVNEQVRRRGIKDTLVLKAMAAVPRHLFVPPDLRELAYSDGPLAIGEGQTISQPYIVALMSQYLHLKGSERVLEIGTGSGYQAAVLAHMAKEVHTVERIPQLAQNAAQVIGDLGLSNVFIHIGDGSLGWPEAAPYQAILVTAAAPVVPQSLIEQLDEGARMVVPVGNRGQQYLELWQRRGDKVEHDAVLPVAFVPLRGEQGWTEEDWD